MVKPTDDSTEYKTQEEKEEEEEDLKEIPSSSLDYEFQLIEPALQRPKKGLVKKLRMITGTKQSYLIDGDGQQIINKDGKPATVEVETYENLSGNLQFWVRDFRLGNLSQWTGEYEYVIYYINLAADFLTEKMPKACITALNKAMSRLELSSSKAAKLRELIQTIRKVSLTGSTNEAEKPDVNTARKYM